MKEYRNPPDVHEPFAAYIHQIEISGSERLLILSGQVGQKQDGTVPADAVEQLDVALDNLLRNLHSASMDAEDIVKLTLYLVGDMDAVKRRDVLAAKLHAHRPCMTLVFVIALANPIYKVEIDAWASKEE